MFNSANSLAILATKSDFSILAIHFLQHVHLALYFSYPLSLFYSILFIFFIFSLRISLFFIEER